MREGNNIMIVDDEEMIRDSLLRMLKGQGYNCRSYPNGEEAVSGLKEGDFALALLDIRMPGMDGIEVLRRIKRYDPDMAVIMVTAVAELDKAVGAMKEGAYDYITKPFRMEEVRLSVHRALEQRRLVLEVREYQRKLELLVEERTERLRQALEEIERGYNMTLEILGAALDTRDVETQAHAKRVRAYALVLARAMGVKEPELTTIAQGVLLHDIGKIGIPDAILRKPGPLTREEYDIMKTHCELGKRLLSGIDFLKGAAEIVYSHQEWYDGRGYPRGLKGEEIPLGARVFAVVDALDAMTSDRPYRNAISLEGAKEEIKRGAGSQFDPEVVETFLSIPDGVWLEIMEAFPDRKREG